MYRINADWGALEAYTITITKLGTRDTEHGTQYSQGGLMADQPLLEVIDLETRFETDAGILRAVDGVSFSLNRGEILGLVGESGCGKSMTALSIMRLVPPPGSIVSGKVLLEGKESGGLKR